MSQQVLQGASVAHLQLAGDNKFHSLRHLRFPIKPLLFRRSSKQG